MRFGKKLPPTDPFDFADKYSNEELCDIGEKIMTKLMNVSDWYRTFKAEHETFVNDVVELAKSEWQNVARTLMKNAMFGGSGGVQAAIDEYVKDKPNLDRLMLKLQQGAALAMVKEPADAPSRIPPAHLAISKDPANGPS